MVRSRDHFAAKMAPFFAAIDNLWDLPLLPSQRAMVRHATAGQYHLGHVVSPRKSTTLPASVGFTNSQFPVLIAANVT